MPPARGPKTCLSIYFMMLMMIYSKVTASERLVQAFQRHSNEVHRELSSLSCAGRLEATRYRSVMAHIWRSSGRRGLRRIKYIAPPSVKSGFHLSAVDDALPSLSAPSTWVTCPAIPGPSYALSGANYKDSPTAKFPVLGSSSPLIPQLTMMALPHEIILN